VAAVPLTRGPEEHSSPAVTGRRLRAGEKRGGGREADARARVIAREGEERIEQARGSG
jgi:hypothetical protein